jgi:uncharacterized protein YigA (DUF484 family)
VKALNSVLEIDPEDLQAQYNLMLCYNGLGDEKQAHEHQVRYLRFKADEASQTITGPYRQLHPEDNNERQAIHEHVSVPLPALGQKGVATLTGGDARHSKNHVGTGTLARSVDRSSTYAAVNPANRDSK